MNTSNTIRRVLASGVIGLVLLVASAGEPGTPTPAPASRQHDMALADAIADQGNRALRQIRAEHTRVTLPPLPAREVERADAPPKRPVRVAER